MHFYTKIHNEFIYYSYYIQFISVIVIPFYSEYFAKLKNIFNFLI